MIKPHKLVINNDDIEKEILFVSNFMFYKLNCSSVRAFHFEKLK
jgi:hypothetical protein